MFHKEMPIGKGLWVWYLDKCLNGDIDAIIKKCHDFDISYLLIKNGNGTDLWTQLNGDIVTKLQDADIKVYSWTYNYGIDPLGEADVANKCLNLGVNGHVFNAESEYRDLPNNVQCAEIMLQAVRAKHPDKVLAHAPFAIIDFHVKFPYVTFGKYCDAVMPQVYYGEMKRTPQQAIMWMQDNFVRWEKNWTESGHADAVKPIIPIAQAFDNFNITPPFVLTPAHIHSFVSLVKDKKSVAFWSFQHIERDDCWAAIRDAKVDAPTDEDLGIVRPAPEETQPVETTTEASVVAVEEQPAVVEAPVETVHEPIVINSPVPREEPAPEQPGDTVHVTPQEKPQRIEMPTNVSIPVSSQPTTVTFKPNKDDPDKMDVIVHGQKTHREYFVEFCRTLIAVVLSLVQSRK